VSRPLSVAMPGILAVLAGLVVLTGPLSAQAPNSDAVLTYEMARDAAEAAEAEAVRNGWAVTIVVVDANSVPIYLKRLTGASDRSYDFAIGKARTAVLSGLSTLEYAQAVAEGSVPAIPDAVTIEGGFPISVDGRVVGAIAASGVPPQQDAIVARAGLATFENR